MFDLIFYKTESGREPAKEFLDSLDDKTAAKELVRKLGFGSIFRLF